MATVHAVKLKALAMDFALACLTIGAIVTPLMLLVIALLDGAALVVGILVAMAAIVATTFWAGSRFDLPFPPWTERTGRETPGKRRYMRMNA
jgi:hypothetical protein